MECGTGGAYLKYRRYKMVATSLLMFITPLISAGCVKTIPMTPVLGNSGHNKIFPVEAALLITAEARGSTTVVSNFEFPIGQALDDAAPRVFSTVFKKVAVVRTREESQRYKLVIEPALVDFDWRIGGPLRGIKSVVLYGGLSLVGVGIAVSNMPVMAGGLLVAAVSLPIPSINESRIKLRITMFSDGVTKVWEREVETPYQEGSEFTVRGEKMESSAGEAASKALVTALNQLTSEMTTDPSLRQLLGGR